MSQMHGIGLLHVIDLLGVRVAELENENRMLRDTVQELAALRESTAPATQPPSPPLEAD